MRRSSFIAALAVFAALLGVVPTAPAVYHDEAGRMYAVASRRLAGLRASRTSQKYRSYWIDCARTFKQVERTFPKSPQAADACFDRAGVYRELYLRSGRAKDIDKALGVYRECRTAHPGNVRAAEALYRVVELSLARKDRGLAVDAYSRLRRSYPAGRWTAKAKARLAKRAGSTRKKRRLGPSIRKTVAAGAGQAGPGPDAVVRDIRYRSGGDYTRIVIDYEGAVTFRARELKNPDRLVFDLRNARTGPSMDSGPLKVNDGVLRRVRSSQYATGVVRVVLDLASIESYAAFPLRDPPRLVIDVMGHNGAARRPPVVQDNAGPGTESGEGPRLSLSRQLGLKVRTIAIDAGHGGHDPGAIGRDGTKEKNITLDIARRLAALITKGLGCTVVMTRDRDEFIPLEDRPAIARTKGADLFISVHVNASRGRNARGIETYIQGLRASDRDAMATAARENAATVKTLSDLDGELTKILAGLRMESNDDDSIRLAHAVQGSLVDGLRPLNGRAADLGVKRAFFYVLINTAMPSILAEVGFISNPAEERLLRRTSYRQEIAEALYGGVKNYVDGRQPRMAAR